VHKRHSLALAVWLLLLALSAMQVFGNTRIETNLSAFLPAAQENAAATLLQELQAGRAAQVILVGIGGGDTQALATASTALAQRLRADERFRYVGNGEAELGDELLTLLLSHRYLLSPAVAASRFTPDSLRTQLQARLQELASPIASFDRRWLREDPTGELRAVLGQWQGGDGPARRLGVWFSEDGDRALLLLRTAAPGFDLEAQQQAIAVVQREFAALAPTGLSLSLSGPGVFAVNASTIIRAETQLLSIASSVLVALLLLAAYRSPRLLVLGALPLGSAILIATACVSLAFGGIHGITLAFGITLLGVAIDYPLHLFSHLSGQDSPERRMRALWPTLRLGVLTTAAGYTALALTDFAGLAQLGLFAMVGLLVAAAFSRWLLPALLPAGFAAPASSQIHKLSDWALRPRPLAAAAALAILAIAALFLGRFEGPVWERDLAALSPISAADRQLDRQLRAELGAAEARDLILVQAPDAEALLQRSERLAPTLSRLVADGALTGFELPSRYLPSAQTQRARQAQLPEPAQLQAALADAMQGLPFKPQAFAAFTAAVDAARRQAPLGLEAIAGTPLELRLSPLLVQGEEQWTAIVPLQGVQAREQIAAALRAEAGVQYLDLKSASEAMLAEFRDEALVRIGWGGLVIALVLWAGLRSLRQGVKVLLPVVAALVVDLALLLALGERLSLFHLVSLLLVAGIGIDYSLFFNRAGPDEEQRQTLHAIVMCAGSSAAVFGLLGMSSLPVLRAIGLTAALGIGLCFAFSWALRGKFRFAVAGHL
jgi:predicted exporter